MKPSFLPLLAIFDIEGVLIPFATYNNLVYPCANKKIAKLDKNGTTTNEYTEAVVDTNGKIVNCFPEIPTVFKMLNDTGAKIAVIDGFKKNHTNDAALLNLFEWDSYINVVEINDSSRVNKLEIIQKKTDIPYNKTLYFTTCVADSEKKPKDLFITPIYEVGITMKVLKDALEFYDFYWQNAQNSTKSR